MSSTPPRVRMVDRASTPAVAHRRPHVLRFVAVLVLGVAGIGVAPAPAVAASGDCLLPDGALTPDDLPAGSSIIECDAVGRVIRSGDVGLTVPEPGIAAMVHQLTSGGEPDAFHIQIATDGTVSYPISADADAIPTVLPPDPCVDDAYNTMDLKEYGTYNWWVGDGSMPGGLSVSGAQAAFADAINNITGSYNDCGLSDTVGAAADYQGRTTYEADVNSENICTTRDEKSTWDAGNLKSGTLAIMCAWAWRTPGAKDDLREADVRYNISDHDFTNRPDLFCLNEYDIRSIGTHEAGHVFGMGHVGGEHVNLTMYNESFACSTEARTLGRGDVLGLRSIY